MRALTRKSGQRKSSRQGKWYAARCAPVGAHLSLAVIKSGFDFTTLTQAITECLSSLAGVSQVHVDSARRTIQVLYDGDQETVANVHRLLAATSCGNPGVSLANR